MPREVVIVTADVDGSEYPSGGRPFTLAEEADAFIKTLIELPGYRSHKIERGGTIAAEVYVVMAGVAPVPDDPASVANEYPSGGRVFGTIEAAREYVAGELAQVPSLRSWKIERSGDGGSQVVDEWYASPLLAVAPPVNAAVESPEGLNAGGQVFEPPG